ncbi:FAD binding domain-containing protein [Mycobacterium vicinigordonae]|uniref:FAD binding domain-containing protein n=1 Tax=Mycobacterium vicinigordonae TaxID=1719132 RepID=A0A7D6E0J6_9MYCO|nr:FAD binding domain-containing protein [Mycobacterium vicinigordonae]QLL09224.1 FAD binding domain-containing protein [Mycobacterium vicinigordonae]
MRPAPFEYLAPGTVEEACTQLCSDAEGTRILAGGQSLMPVLVRRQDRPRRLVDITKIPELQQFSATDSHLQVGAAVTQRTVEMSDEVHDFNVLAQALPRVGKVTTRNRGTVCGSLAYANPAAEIGICLIVLGGEVTAISARGIRAIPSDEFFLGPRRTALQGDELLHTVRFNRPGPGTTGFFDEVTIRGPGDTPLVSAAVIAQMGADRTSAVRIAIGGAGQAPVLAGPEICASLANSLDDDTIDHVGRTFAAELGFTTDAHVGGDYRRRLAVRILGRLLRRLRGQLR